MVSSMLTTLMSCALAKVWMVLNMARGLPTTWSF